jgi:hypothetical protein
MPASGHHRYQWLYLYGFVRPATGEVVWFIADGVNTALFRALLASFAAEVGPTSTSSWYSTVRAGTSPRIWWFQRALN